MMFGNWLKTSVWCLLRQSLIRFPVFKPPLGLLFCFYTRFNHQLRYYITRQRLWLAVSTVITPSPNKPLNCWHHHVSERILSPSGQTFSLPVIHAISEKCVCTMATSLSSSGRSERSGDVSLCCRSTCGIREQWPKKADTPTNSWLLRRERTYSEFSVLIGHKLESNVLAQAVRLHVI